MNQRVSRGKKRREPSPARVPTWAKVLIAVVGVFVALRIFAALSISGTQSYLRDAKTSEAKATVASIARGMVACMEREESELVAEGPPGQRRRELPGSSPAVPASVPKGTKYMSAPQEWTSPAFTCARFSMSTPMYFQYEWERVSPLVGIIHARADLDGDGRVDANLSEEIRCTAGGACTPGPLLLE